MTDVVVAGAGLGGLIAARRIAAAGLDVSVFERRSTVGGRVRSRAVDGFTLDRGFQVLFTAYPAVRRELDLDALDLRYFSPGAVIARPGKRSTLSDPFRDPGAAIETLFNRELRLGDKLRLLSLRRDLRRRDSAAIFPGGEQSIDQFIADRGFSQAFTDAFVAPFYGGITLDRSLSTSAAVFEYTFKMLNEGRIGVPARGMGAIPEQLATAARTAGAKIELGVEVTAVEGTSQPGAENAQPPPQSRTVTVRMSGESITADAAIIATDPETASSLTDVDTIPRKGCGCVTQYYSLPSTTAIPTGKRLHLNAQDADPNHLAPLSTVAPEYAPDGRQLLSATFLGQPEADDDELAERTRRTLASWYPAVGFDAMGTVHTDRIEFAQFDQPPGVHATLPAPDAPADGVYLAGDYTQWSSIQGALESGKRAADMVLKDLG